MNEQELIRTLRHEYVHAVTAELSGSKCPAWVDEGLAQIFERSSETELRNVLSKWTKKNQFIPLSQLEKGFIALDHNFAAAAYAESFFAMQMLLREHDTNSLVDFFRVLQDGQTLNRAFRLAYASSLDSFENTLRNKIAKSDAAS